VFGTEAVPHTKTALQQLFGDELYQIYYRFLETQPEYFGFAPAPTPPQGAGVSTDLDCRTTFCTRLHKMYSENAVRLMGIESK
jgi:hypothetical protein